MGIEELMLDRAKKKGIQKGIQTGKQEGLKEGERKKAIEMKKDELPIAQISRYTKLTIEEIKKL